MTHHCYHPVKSPDAIECYVDPDGDMWVMLRQSDTARAFTVNFCPFCGEMSPNYLSVAYEDDARTDP
jgi:hypothetical protein